MSQIFAYCRVSTADQTNDNQIQEIKAAGFDVTPPLIFSEVVAAYAPVVSRCGFMKLLDNFNSGDVLVVTRLDGLGCNMVDVRTTLSDLVFLGVHVYCLQLGRVDLTSHAGKTIMQVINAAADFEQNYLNELAQANLKQAKADANSAR